MALRPGERADCTRCGTLLERRSWLGTDAGLAFALAGAALALPALTLPFITVAKLGREHVGLALSGAVALWDAGMRLLAIWVALCGAVTPVVMLLALTTVLMRARVGRHHIATERWRRIAHIVEHWAMPEVHVLAVLVAMIKLGDLVHVEIGAGFWCYVAMSMALLLAWRGFDLEPLGPAMHPRKTVQ
ncbi:MAG TPA: paraquat-inducible protein A [Opitutaceae bacterium]|nr:paraquat-inducible protein A [Opitutaceae bacterium]